MPDFDNRTKRNMVGALLDWADSNRRYSEAAKGRPTTVAECPLTGVGTRGGRIHPEALEYLAELIERDLENRDAD